MKREYEVIYRNKDKRFVSTHVMLESLTSGERVYEALYALRLMGKIARWSRVKEAQS